MTQLVSRCNAMEWKEEWNLTNCSRSKEEKCSGKKRKRQKRGPRDIDLTNSTSVSNIMIYFDVRLQCFSWNEETTDKSVNKTVKGWFWILLESCEPFWPPVPHTVVSTVPDYVPDLSGSFARAIVYLQNLLSVLPFYHHMLLLDFGWRCFFRL